MPSLASPAKVFSEIEFAPQEGLVKQPEAGFRNEICLNGTWRFHPVALPADWVARQGVTPELPAPFDDGWDPTPIRIPSPWNVNSFGDGDLLEGPDGADYRSFPSYPASWEDVKMGWLEREFTVPADWDGQRIFIQFEAISGHATVLVNGQHAGDHFDLFLPTQIEVTDLVRRGASNTVRVGVRAPELFDVDGGAGRRPYPGGSMWSQHIAGIWQDVVLLGLPAVRVSDVFVQPKVADGVLRLELEVCNDTSEAAQVVLSAAVQPWINEAGADPATAAIPAWSLGDTVLSGPPARLTVEAGAVETLVVDLPVKGELAYWTPETPNLYALLVDLEAAGRPADRKYTRFGWREWTFAGDQHLLNGKPYELRGDGWHCLGVTQFTRRYPWAWYTALKAANGNAARPHAAIYPRCFMEVADEMGIAILSETANWASDGGPKFDSEMFWRRSEEQLRGLILRDRNHASIFGWSITNENRPVILNVMRRPELLDRQIRAWREWVDLARELDPTRPWISGDGDDDGDGTLPTVVGHYGDEAMMKRWSQIGKPWGVGEHGMAYYGSPLQVSRFNGARAYESMEGRMEGLAIEACELIADQRELKASFVSVFNLCWYALKPLALGMRDTSRAPELEDGVHFAGYTEGKPGYQPERIGPYSTTFNPGYVADQPLYEPWAMYEGIRDAYAPAGSTTGRWSRRPEDTGAARFDLPEPVAVEILSAGDSPVVRELKEAGVESAPPGTGEALVIDGSAPPRDADAAGRVAQVLADGGTVWVWSPTSENLDAIQKLVAVEMSLAPREATSLVIRQDSPMTSGLTHADFYFCETQDAPVIKLGIAGPVLETGEVLLAACDTNWRRWNKVAEIIKASGVLRSEREVSGPGAAMVRVPVGPGSVVISTLEPIAGSETGVTTLRTLLTNAGIRLDTSRVLEAGRVIDDQGTIRRALAVGGFRAPTLDAARGGDWVTEKSVQPKEKDSAGELSWTPAKTESTGSFDFHRMGMAAADEKAATYLSFWLWSPRPLDDLLAEPDMPSVDLLIGADDSFQVRLNGQTIHDEIRRGSFSADEFVIEALPLKTGWNHFLVKSSSGGGAWGFTGRFRSSKPEFMGQLKSALAKN